MPVRFFMGTNTPGGFVSFPGDFYDIDGGWRVYLFKGGMGTDKTALLSRVCEHMAARGQNAHAIFCALNPGCLDGLVFEDIKVCILNSDSPHNIEPKCWGAVEQIVNLSACMNAYALQDRVQDIVLSISAFKKLTERCRNFLSAAASLLRDSCRIANGCTDAVKIQRNASRIASREFPIRDTIPGKEKRRFLSAITPDGDSAFHETIQHLCPRIYSIEDEQGASSRLLINELRQRALQAGHDVLSCYCPLFPYDKPEHILIPSIGIGFITSNSWHKADYPVYRRIHAARFTDSERLRQRRQLLSFNRRAAHELINEAVSIQAEARAEAEKTRRLYAAHTDHEGAELLIEWVISELDECLVGT